MDNRSDGKGFEFMGGIKWNTLGDTIVIVIVVRYDLA